MDRSREGRRLDATWEHSTHTNNPVNTFAHLLSTMFGFSGNADVGRTNKGKGLKPIKYSGQPCTCEFFLKENFCLHKPHSALFFLEEEQEVKYMLGNNTNDLLFSFTMCNNAPWWLLLLPTWIYVAVTFMTGVYWCRRKKRRCDASPFITF